MIKKSISCLLIGISFIPVFAQKQYTLEECRQMAIDNNKSLKVTKEKIVQEHSKNKAAFTKYLPDLTFTGTYMYNSRNLSLLSEDAHLPVGSLMSDGSFGFRADQVNNQFTMVNGTPVPLDNTGQPFNPKTNPEKILWKDYALLPKEAMEFDIHNVFAGVLTLSQPIYMGGKIRAYNKITKYSEELAKTKHTTNYEETLLKTDELYWQVVSLVSKKRLADSYVRLIQKMDSDVVVMVKTGVATKADELTVKVKLNQAETTLSKVENGLSLSRMALCQVCGVDLRAVMKLQDEDTQVEEQPVILSDDMTQHSSQRSELKSLDLANKIYKEKESVVRADMLPQVLLTGNYMVMNPNSYNGYEKQFAGMWNVGVAVRIPIFHWGETYHEMKAARSESRVIKLEYEEAKEKIELQINQSVFKINESVKRLGDAKKNLERADENLKYATTGFESGVIPASSLLEAQTAWLSANSERIDAEIDVRLCKTYLAKATGQLK